MTAIDPSNSGTFDDRDVAACYAHRPPYPPELYHFLLDLVPDRSRALDLGCGPGKIARALGGHFGHVDAVDPAIAMIEAGRRQAGTLTNIGWLATTAEDAPLAGPYDLVTAGASIHWMKHEVVFPRLAEQLHQQGVVAIVSGDNVLRAPWLEDWQAFVSDWLNRVGRTPDEQGFAAALRSYEPWMDIEGNRDFDFPFTQDLRSFVECQHSRATWARSWLGSLSTGFDADLTERLAPYALDGKISYEVRTTLTWGKPRAEPRRA